MLGGFLSFWVGKQRELHWFRLSLVTRRSNAELPPEHSREIGKIVETHDESGVSDGRARLSNQLRGMMNSELHYELAKIDPDFFLEVPAELKWAQVADSSHSRETNFLCEISFYIRHRWRQMM
jgi:hypothetical protein